MPNPNRQCVFGIASLGLVLDWRGAERATCEIRCLNLSNFFLLRPPFSPHILEQREAAIAAHRGFAVRYGDFERLARVFESWGIRRRYAVPPMEWCFERLGWPERSQAYLDGACQLDHERTVLADYGNMSAPTALFVLERLVQAELPSRTLLTAMGPRFTASCVSLRREM